MNPCWRATHFWISLIVGRVMLGVAHGNVINFRRGPPQRCKSSSSTMRSWVVANSRSIQSDSRNVDSCSSLTTPIANRTKSFYPPDPTETDLLQPLDLLLK